MLLVTYRYSLPKGMNVPKLGWVTGRIIFVVKGQQENLLDEKKINIKQ
jgi:hypothetical protein